MRKTYAFALIRSCFFFYICDQVERTSTPARKSSPGVDLAEAVVVHAGLEGRALAVQRLLRDKPSARAKLVVEGAPGVHELQDARGAVALRRAGLAPKRALPQGVVQNLEEHERDHVRLELGLEVGAPGARRDVALQLRRARAPRRGLAPLRVGVEHVPHHAPAAVGHALGGLHQAERRRKRMRVGLGAKRIAPGLDPVESRRRN